MKFRFADCVLDSAAHRLIRAGEDIKIEPQVFDFLMLMAQSPGRLISRDTLIERVWGGRIVSESAISARIAAARRAVGDDGKAQAIIRTVPRRGVKMVAEVVADTAAPAVPAAPAPAPPVRFASADDGTRLAYAVSGSGPPLIRVAHYPSHLELEWHEATERALFDRLGQDRTLVRLDHRGSGLSDIEIDGFSPARSAEDIGAVADAAGFDRFALFGASSGAMTAVDFAARHPDRVTHLVLLASYAEGRGLRAGGPGTDAPETIMSMAAEGWDTPGSPFVSGYIAIYFPDAQPDLLDQIARQVQDSCPRRNAQLARDAFNRHSILPVLAKVRAPTLVMHSRGDAVHPLDQGRKVASGIPGAAFRVLESRNHYPLPDEPAWQAMVAATLEFLGQ